MICINRQRKYREPASQQAGMVSIIVTVILMFVISITVLGFAQIIRQSQRQALDSQLSSQAFYAAETGINDARTIINQLPTKEIPAKTNCGEQLPVYPLDGKIDPASGTSYSCLLINGAPESLSYDLSTTSPSKIVPLLTDGTATISKLVLEWTAPTPAGGAPVGNPSSGCSQNINPSLPVLSAWTCGYGMIRVDLVPTNSLNRYTLMSDDFTAFLTPAKSGAGAISYDSSSGSNIYGGNSNQGSRPSAKCDDASCKLTITNLGGTKYYMRVSTLYKNATLRISALDDSNNPVDLYGAQILIDSTGKANDVLRRIQVRLPLTGDGLHSDYGLESTNSICKKFTAFPGYPNATPCF